MAKALLTEAGLSVLKETTTSYYLRTPVYSRDFRGIWALFRCSAKYAQFVEICIKICGIHTRRLILNKKIQNNEKTIRRTSDIAENVPNY